MEENKTKKPKMKLWKKILIGIAVLFILSKLFGSSDKKDESKPTESTSVESKEKLEEENKKLKEENKKLKEDFEAAKSTIKMYVDKEIDAEKKEEPKKEEPKNKETNKNVSREYQNALKMAENYIKTLPFSKQRLYEQLTSEHGSKFPEDAAQYAIDNLKVDYKEQALKSAKNYMKTMPMSNDELYEQLTSEYGEKFTAEEAQYAIDNLDK